MKLHNVPIKNLSFTLVSHLLSLVISFVIFLLVPKFLSIKEYGSFHFFILLTSYSGFFHFGWMDGLLLRLTGKIENELNKSLIASQFLIFIVFEFLLWTLVITVIKYTLNIDSKFIYIASAACAFVILINTFSFFLYQILNRMIEYSILYALQRCIYLILIIFCFVKGWSDCKILIFAFLISQIFVTILGLYRTKSIWCHIPSSAISAFREIRINISVGSKLMLATISSMLIVGILRLSIQFEWGAEIFGQVALLFSIISIINTCLNALAIASFPSLRMFSIAVVRKIYLHIRITLSFVFLSLLLITPIITIFLNIWLPNYNNIIYFLPILMPLCLYECLINLLFSTYLKALRKERNLLIGNFSSLIISIIFCLISVYIFESLFAVILSLLISEAMQSNILEYLLSKQTKKYNIRLVLTENFLILLYVISCLAFDNIVGTCIYGIVFVFMAAFSDYSSALHLSLKLILGGSKN